MPTYEYGCEACGHEWEEIQRITEPPLEVCPACSKPSAHRLISAGTNFILKGGGWYSDLYTSPKPKAESATKTETKADTSGDKTSGDKADKSTTKPSATQNTAPTSSTSSTSSTT
jgi:putative FmdB family regulatory protein